MPNVKVINPKTSDKKSKASEITLKTDEEILVAGNSSPQDRVRRLKAIMRAKTTLLSPEMIDIIADHARGPNPKISLEAAKYLLDRGLGTPEKEVADDPTSANSMYSNEEIEATLGGSNDDTSD